ncbi:MAG: DUF2341 domain-containing protein [Promethearchaeota archaeon]
MKITKINKNRIRVLTFLFIFMASSVFLSFPINTSISEDIGKATDENIEKPTNKPTDIEVQLSGIGDDPWWNNSFEFRRVINITNTGSLDFVNLPFFSIVINYTELVNAGKMDGDLKDVRIVENGQLREYWIEKDYPVADNATIWFKANCSAGAKEYDTYLYYGNSTVDYANKYLMDYNPMGNIWFPFDDDYKDHASGITSSTPGGNPTLINGIKGKCGDFERSENDYVLLGDPAELDLDMNQTIMMWIKTESMDARQNPYAKEYGGSGTITVEVSGSVSYYYGQSGRNAQPYQGFGMGSGNIVAGKWRHIALVRDLSNMQLYWYRNGTVRRSTVATYSPAVPGDLTAYIGRGYVSNFDGLIDDLRIFPDALDYDEINMYKNYEYIIEGKPMEEVERGAIVHVEVRDLDGRLVPNAVVHLINSTNDIIDTADSGDDGIATFIKIPYGEYNISVEYTLGAHTKTIYNSTVLNQPIDLQSVNELIVLYTDIWTIDFEVVDWDYTIMDYGFVEVYNDTGKTELLANLTLESSTGKATFRWINKSDYTYKLYYKNLDYNPKHTLLNSSTIYRTDLSKQTEIWVNQTAIGSFLTQGYVWADGSGVGVTGTTRIINATIELKKMTDEMTKVDIYYINNQKQAKKIDKASKTYTVGGTQEDTIEIDVIDDYSAYGLRIDVYGNNATMCNGTINVKYTQTTSEYIRVNMSKVELKVQDGGVGVTGAVVNVFNNRTGQLIVSLITSSGEVYGKKGYAYDETNKLDFWYLRDTYNFTIDFFTDLQATFDVEHTKPGSYNLTNINSYNYTVNKNSTIFFGLTNTANYRTNFTDYAGKLNATYGENLNYNVTYQYTTDDGNSWNPIIDPIYVRCSVYIWSVNPTLLKQFNMNNLGDGNYTVEFNSNLFSAGDEGKNYMVVITASKKGYSDPLPIFFPIIVYPISTGMSLHNYSASHETVGSVSQYYNELVNISVSYYEAGKPLNRITGAVLSYEWDYGSGNGIGEDPIYSEYYTFTINTSSAPNVGTYSIRIRMEKENYTDSVDGDTFSINIEIRTRPTSINDHIKLQHIAKSVWIKDAYNFTFIYKDITNGLDKVVGGLETATYSWYKLDSSGSPLSGSGNEGEDVLIENLDKTYTLDFDTETRDTGDYAIFIIMKKDNYEVRNAFIDLTIKKREIDTDLSANYEITDKIIEVIKGDVIELKLKLTDPTKNDVPLTDAKVTLTLGDESLNFDEGDDGEYTLTIDTEKYEALFTAETLTGVIKIEKEDYNTIEIDVTIVINMEEIFPGMPIFYFFMMVAAVSAVVIALVSYRAIQQAKIPKFVKKVRDIKKTIQSRKSISDSLMYPSKLEAVAKQFSKDWELLGLSLEDILGTTRKKGKTLGDIKKQPEGGMR